MEFVKLCAVLASAAVISVMIKEQNKGFQYLVAVTGTLISVFFAIGCISPIIQFVTGVGSLNGEIFQILLRILGISYLTDLSSSICKDVGESSLAMGIDLCGKAEILVLSMPMFKELVSICVNLLN